MDSRATGSHMILVRKFFRRYSERYSLWRMRGCGLEFRVFAHRYFDRDFYLLKNPDVAKAGRDAFTHWTRYGIREERIFSPEISVKIVPSQIQKDPSLAYVGCGSKLLEVRRRPRLPEVILRQLMTQGEHDPILFGPGARALSNLPIRPIGEFNIDLEKLSSVVDLKPRVIFVIPLLVIGGGEKYAADICRVFQSRGAGPIIVIVTDQNERDAVGWRDLAVVEPFREAKVLFWRDICSNPMEPQLLASVILYLKPNILVVTYSGVCLQAVAQHGRRLSQKIRIFCTYFNLGSHGLGAPYGVTFARRTTPFATSLTDNKRAAVVLDQRFDAFGKQTAVIPPRISVVSRPIFDRKLADRMTKEVRGAKQSWVWVSRVDKAKGIDMLRSLAEMRPQDTFDVYGPLFSSLKHLRLDRPNIRYRGILKDILLGDFSNYRGFLFTSPLEGMPNVVLEMTQHAIPLIMSDAGGLTETFDSESAIIVPTVPDAVANARAFNNACDRLASMPRASTAAMATKAYEAVCERHAPDRFETYVCDVFGV